MVRSCDHSWAALVVAINLVLVCSRARAQLALDQADRSQAIKFEASYVADIASNVHGGVQRGTDYLDAVGVTATVEGQAWGWPGASWFLYGLGSQGGTPGEDTGVMQGVSNIEAHNTWKLYEAWFNYDALDGGLSFRGGLYDVNSEFDVIETAGMFVNPSHGIGADISQTGLNGPSIFPTTSLALRLRAQLNDRVYVQGAVLDGVPGSEVDPNGTHVHWSRADGLLAMTEVGYLHPRLSSVAKFAVGAWHYTGAFEAIDGAGGIGKYRGQYGVYALTDWPLTRERGTTTQGLSAFLRYGIADSNTNAIAQYIGAGFVYCGLVPGRSNDKLGVALAAAVAGDRYRAMTHGDRAEVVVEFAYSYQMKPWLWLQPDVQYVANPAMNPAVSNAVVLITRLTLSFEAVAQLRRGK